MVPASYLDTGNAWKICRHLYSLPKVNGKHHVGVVDVVMVLTMRLEIDPKVDFDSRRAVYFHQMRYGLFIRTCSLVD